MKLFVGLGNPGSSYPNTRHNLGQIALYHLFEGEFKLEKSLKSLVCSMSIDGEKYIGAFPQTYMNLSGEAVVKLASYYSVSINDIVVLHDEVELPAFEVRYKYSGGHKGHNGIRDIITRLGNADFHRIRLGVARPGNPEIPVADYLLSALPEIPGGFFESVVSTLVSEGLWSEIR